MILEKTAKKGRSGFYPVINIRNIYHYSFPRKNKIRAGLEEVGSFFWGGGNGEPKVPRKIEIFMLSKMKP
jgi:hypothetical protein